MSGPLSVLTRLLGDVRSIDDAIYRALVDLKLHMHRQSLLASAVARALLPGGSGLMSTALVLLAVRVAASLCALAAAAFDAYLKDVVGLQEPERPQPLAPRAALSGNTAFRVGMELLEGGAPEEDFGEGEGADGLEEAGSEALE